MRALHLIGIVALTATGSMGCITAHAAEPTKPIQECDREFKTRETALHAQGVSAAKFFHECWWHSRAGQTTDLSPDDARVRESRIQHEPPTGGPHREAGVVAQRSTNARKHMASIEERRSRRHEARLQRRQERLVAMRARRLTLVAEARRSSPKRIAVANSRLPARNHEAKIARLAYTSRRDHATREAFALRRERRERVEEAAIDPSLIPANAVEGRRSWIGASTPSGPTTAPAVLIGPLSKNALKGSALHCWDQNVLYLSGTAHWKTSLVCDSKTQVGAQKIWFEQYDAKM